MDLYRTQLLHYIHLLGLIPDGVSIVEPAVILISHFAVSQRVALVCRLGQLLLHLEQLKVAAVPRAHILLLTGLKGSTLHTVSVEQIHKADAVCNRAELGYRARK